MFSFGKKKELFLGLDISSSSIKLIQLDKTRAGIEVLRYVSAPSPANSIREGLIAEPDAVGSVLMELLGSAGLPPSGPSPTIQVIVPAQAVVIRLMPVPTGMPPEELADVVTQEATNHIPFPIEDANLDWSLMPATERTDADGVRRVDVIVAAVQRSIVESYWRLADSAGVKLGRVDISSLSVIRSLALAGYLGSSGILSMIVNIRHDATDINIVRSAMPLFGRSIILGVESLAEAVARSLNVQFDQALDMLPGVQLFGTAPMNAETGQAAQVARTIFSDIADELTRSLEFYRSQVGDVKIDQIVLCGPGCIVPGLDQFITHKLNVRTVLSNPMRDLIFNHDQIPEPLYPVLASLIGTSVESTWVPSFTVDLDMNKGGRLPLTFDATATQLIAPPEVSATPWLRPALYSGIALMMIIAAIWAFIDRIDIPNKEREALELQTTIDQRNQQLKKLSKVVQENDFLLKRKKILDTIVKKTDNWSEAMEALRDNIPPAVHIDRILFQGKKLIVEGKAVDFTNISHFALNLEGSPLITDPSIEWATRKDKTPEVINFSLVAKVNKPDQPSLLPRPELQGAEMSDSSQKLGTLSKEKTLIDKMQ